MKITHFTLGSVDPDSSNGINRVIESLCTFCNVNTKSRMQVLGVRHKNPSSETVIFDRSNFRVTTCRTIEGAINVWLREFYDTNLVHFHNVWSLEHVKFARVLEKRRVPYVITPYAAFESDRMSQKHGRKKLFNFLGHRDFLNHAGAVIACAREEVFGISQYVDSRKISFLPNSAHGITLLQTERNLRDNESKITFTYLGRISREKNILSLIQAAKILTTHINTPFSVELFGDYNNAYGQHCNSLIQSLGLSDICYLKGKVSSKEKPAVFERCDVYVQPSFSDATPLSVVEAISCGKSVLATRTSGLSYLHGLPFFQMVEPTPKELAFGMKYFIENSSKIQSNSAAAINYYENFFSSGAVTTKMMRLYDDVIHQRETLPIY